MILQAQQRSELAGKTKLTAVTLHYCGTSKTEYHLLRHDSRGAAILPQHLLDRMLSKTGVKRGDTYTVG